MVSFTQRAVDFDDNEMMMKQTISVIGVCHRLLCDGYFVEIGRLAPSKKWTMKVISPPTTTIV